MLIFFLAEKTFSQRSPLSITTDLDYQRSLKKGQHYSALGQTAQMQFHFTPKETLYTWFSYYALGKFSNDLTATAKLLSTNPQKINFINNAQMRFKHLSVGWKHYFKGTSDDDNTWNLYGYAGFGLMFGFVQNSFSVPVDTASYIVPILNGSANFRRLTFDLGLGYEIPFGPYVFFYNEVKVLIPTTDYPSPYILLNYNAPLMASLNFGFRFLFD